MLDKNEFCNLNITNAEEFKSLLYSRDSNLFRVDELCVEDATVNEEKMYHKRIAAIRVVYKGHKAKSIFIVNGRGKRILTAISKGRSWVVYKGVSKTPSFDHLGYYNLVALVKAAFQGCIVLYSGNSSRFFMQNDFSMVTETRYQIEKFLESIYGGQIPPMYLEYLNYRFSDEFPRELNPQSIVLLYRAVISKFDFELFYKAVLF